MAALRVPVRGAPGLTPAITLGDPVERRRAISFEVFLKRPYRRGGGLGTLVRGPERRLRSDLVTGPLCPKSSSRLLVRICWFAPGAVRSHPPPIFLLGRPKCETALWCRSRRPRSWDM